MANVTIRTLKKYLEIIELHFIINELNKFNAENNTAFTLSEYVLALSVEKRRSYFLHAPLAHMLMWNHDVKREFILWAICNNHTAKMRGMASVSTACTCNEHCKEHAKVDGSVCSVCYAQNQLAYQKSTDEHYTQCYTFFTNVDLTIEDIPVINRVWFRIESFGDVDNERQERNYMLFAKKNPHCRFVQWSKNPWIIADALEHGTVKPDNYYIIVSSMFLNKAFTLEQLERAKWLSFVDAVFTVYTDEYIEEHNITINCGGNECITCLQCYTLEHGTVTYINERKK